MLAFVTTEWRATLKEPEHGVLHQWNPVITDVSSSKK
jgi:hypothetical protein